jgi:hypothetical protein
MNREPDPNLPTHDPLVRRLRQLSAHPVDTTSLDRALLAAIPRPRSSGSMLISRWARSTRGIAATVASISVIGVVILVIALATRPVLAEPTSMAELHRDLISGRLPMTRVTSVQDANVLLSQSWPDAPEVPTLQSLPPDHDLACCLKDVKGRRVVCVVLEDDGIPISIVVAPKENVRAPQAGPTVTDHTRETPLTSSSRTMVHTSGSITMLMVERDGLFVCVMGETTPQRLRALLDSMRF